MGTKNLEEHRRNIIGARRKNNIYGETTDYIIMGILELGADAAFYNPVESQRMPVTIWARNNDNLYIIQILHKESADSNPTFTQENKANLETYAVALGAKPLYAINKSYCRQIKFYNTLGDRVTRLDQNIYVPYD